VQMLSGNWNCAYTCSCIQSAVAKVNTFHGMSTVITHPPRASNQIHVVWYCDCHCSEMVRWEVLATTVFSIDWEKRCHSNLWSLYDLHVVGLDVVLCKVSWWRYVTLLLARLMGLYCFARWCLSSYVMLPAGGPAAGQSGSWHSTAGP